MLLTFKLSHSPIQQTEGSLERELSRRGRKPEDLGMLLKGWTCTSNTDLKQQGSFFVVSEACHVT